MTGLLQVGVGKSISLEKIFIILPEVYSLSLMIHLKLLFSAHLTHTPKRIVKTGTRGSVRSLHITKGVLGPYKNLTASLSCSRRKAMISQIQNEGQLVN